MTMDLASSAEYEADDLSTSAYRTNEIIPRDLLFKRIFDVLGSIGLLLLLLPLFALVSLVILIQRERGPLFFAHKRVGLSGRSFNCLKFRTMHVNSDEILAAHLARSGEAREEWEVSRKLQTDPRVTPVGRVLRSTSLDELPQLFNVLRGDMSLVGPRPVTQPELDGPYTEYDGRSEYLAVRPGLTGLWQISGRSNVSYRNRVAMDKRYVRSICMQGDAWIILKTVYVVSLRRGAR